MSSVFEIRDYHYRTDRIDEYRKWAGGAARILGDRLDIVGFWLDAGIPARVMGSDPMDLPHGSANVTWVIRWDDLEQRETMWAALWEDDEWMDEWAAHPGYDGYLHMSVRFMRNA